MKKSTEWKTQYSQLEEVGRTVMKEMMEEVRIMKEREEEKQAQDRFIQERMDQHPERLMLLKEVKE